MTHFFLSLLFCFVLFLSELLQRVFFYNSKWLCIVISSVQTIVLFLLGFCSCLDPFSTSHNYYMDLPGTTKGFVPHKATRVI